MTSWPSNRRTTAPDLVAAKNAGAPWIMLTSYDALTAPIFEEAGAKVLLVGDTAGMVVYGHPNTVSVTLDDLIPLAAAVVRSTKSALIVGDMPFGTYQESPAQAVRCATRLMKEAGVGAVKLEGGLPIRGQIEALVNAGIPVIGHLGLTPQSVNALGGYKVQGRGDAAEAVLMDAKALESAGVSAIVLEAVPLELGRRVTAELAIPTIGIGAGPHTDAQVMVWQDLLGLTRGHLPKFVKPYANLAATMTDAVSRFVEDVGKGEFPDDEHSYH